MTDPKTKKAQAAIIAVVVSTVLLAILLGSWMMHSPVRAEVDNVLDACPGHWYIESYALTEVPSIYGELTLICSGTELVDTWWKGAGE